MSVHYNPLILDKIARFQLVIDTNILSSCSANKDYLKSFLSLFRFNAKLIDPVVRLEFLRNAYTEKILDDKQNFLEYNNFQFVTDTPEDSKKIMQNAFQIARIYAHNGNAKIPLGDLLIVSRLQHHFKQQLFLTLDKSDFSTILFDRVGVISIEKISSNNHNILEHIIILRFNNQKYKDCFSRLL